ncbi:MAG: penicillin-binding protein 2 [Gemmatimonadaceae bacterium]
MSHQPNDVLQRARVARSILTLVFVALASAFFRAQVLRKDYYDTVAKGNRQREIPLPGARATILDRHGEIIAENLPGYSVSLLSPTEDSLRTALHSLARVVDIDSAQQEVVMRRFRGSPQRPAVIFNDASFEVVSVLEERRSEFPGLIIQSTPKRFYPEGEAVASFMGYTGEISQQELAKEKFAGYKPGQQVGKQGLEQQYEGRLRGREGSRAVEVDARNRVVRDHGVAPDIAPESPPPLRTNIDLGLQKYAHEYFGDSLRGAMVAIEPKTGAVLALYSAPTYDINRFIGGIARNYYQSLIDDPRKPLFNKVTQGRYPPASTFKLATAAMGLEAGLVTMDTHMEKPCTGGYMYGGRYFKCWDHKGHGDINLAQAIAKSCDVYFYQLGLKISLLKFVAGGVDLGFLKRSGIDLPDEKPPLFPDSKAYFDRLYGPRGWADGIVLNLAIGQGEDAQTPLNMAKFYAALAIDGKAAPPRIVPDSSVTREQVIKLAPDQLKGLQDALADVLSRGTGQSAQIKGLTIAGKTGTAQNPPNPDHAWFVGYAPANDPKIVVAVMLEFGLHGSAAAKIATKMMERYLNTHLTLTSTPVE